VRRRRHRDHDARGQGHQHRRDHSRHDRRGSGRRAPRLRGDEQADARRGWPQGRQVERTQARFQEDEPPEAGKEAEVERT
jgi:hypothetical protein